MNIRLKSLVALLAIGMAFSVAIADQTPTIVKRFYDESGKLIRTIDEKGYISNYIYGNDGKTYIKTHEMTTDPKTLAELAQKESALLAQIDQTQDLVKRGDLLEDLGFLYAHQLQEPQKALALIPLMTVRIQIFNVKAHVIEGDFKTSDAEKIVALNQLAQEFPEQQHLINTLISISQTNVDKIKQFSIEVKMGAGTINN